MDVIKMLKEAQKTHIDWAEFLEKYPAAEFYQQYKHIGNAELHRKYIKEYDEVIAFIKQLQSENPDLHKEYQSIAGALDKACAELDKHRWIPVSDPPEEKEPKNRAKRLFFQKSTHNIWSVGYDYENYRWPAIPKSATHYKLITLPEEDKE